MAPFFAKPLFGPLFRALYVSDWVLHGTVFRATALWNALSRPLRIGLGVTIKLIRIWAACALLSVGASPGMIQAICRWKSEDSLRIYARSNPEMSMLWVKRMAVAETSSRQIANMPMIDVPVAQLTYVSDHLIKDSQTSHESDDDVCDVNIV